MDSNLPLNANQPPVSVPPTAEPILSPPPASKKRIILIALVIFIIVPGIAIFAIRQPAPEVTSPKPEQIRIAPTPTTAAWQSYQTPYFTVSYPPDWKISIVSNTNGQQILSLGPSLDKGIRLPGITIDAREASTSASLEESIGTLTNLFSFHQISSQTTGKFTKIYVGTLPFYELNGTVEKSPVQERVTSLFTSGIAYQVVLMYQGDKENSMYESIYTKLLSTFITL